MNKPELRKTRFTNKTETVILASAIVIALLRVLFIGLMGIMPQDAYYHFYGEHLALSYFDHPPAIAYLLRTFTTIFGKHVFVLKLADSLVTLLTVFTFYRLSKCFLSTHKVWNAFFLFFSTLMITLLSMVSTPDVPLILFWSLSLLMLYHAIFLDKKMFWLWSGIMMGLSFDSKYTGVFLPFGLVLFLVLSRQYRRFLFSRWLYLSLALFLVTISPVIIWNVQNNFASFRFQSAGRIESSGGLHISLSNFFGVVGHQSAVLMPVLFFGLVFFLIKFFRKYILKRVAISSQKLFLFSFFIPVFLGFFAISLVYWVKLNWMMPAYISGIILISTYFTEKWIRYQLVFSLVVHLLLSVEIITYAIPIRSDDTWYGWEQLAQQVKVLEKEYPGTFVFSADDYKTSAVLNFYLDHMIYSRNVIGETALQFDYVGTDLNSLKGRDALFINSIPNFTSGQKENIFPASLPAYFDSVAELQPVMIRQRGKAVRKFLIFYCKNYRPMPKTPVIHVP